jgi:hypothetical protein
MKTIGTDRLPVDRFQREIDPVLRKSGADQQECQQPGEYSFLTV